ncbi:MAG: dipicolinate synthase subunit B [Clostridiales bacterium]|nr:dipicolinate synthase subunit B [Clostridiales bacterium]
MNRINVGFAMCGSFCTFSQIPPVMKQMRDRGYELIPIMTPTAYYTDTRFGKAADINREIEDICGNKILKTITEVEPIGPKKMLDILVIAPCTGNTIGKLANGIYDTSVTLAAKSHMRNKRPVLIAVSTNDALSSTAMNIGKLMNSRNMYFVPFSQDDCEKKPTSIVADFSSIPRAVELALKGEQQQPVIEK